MVESEAKELSEEVMLGAVTFGHRAVPAGDRGDHRAGRDAAPRSPGRCRPPARELEAIEARLREPIGRRLAAAYARARQAGAQQTGSTRPRRRSAETCSPTTQPAAGAQAVQGAGEGDRARRDPATGERDRRPRHQDGAADRRPRSASCRARMARRCSPAARPRRSWWPRSAPARTSRSSTRSRASTARTSCCTTISRPTRPAKPGRMGSPGRREIGHGKLAWRAIRPLLPTKESFPYTIRVVSEITEFERLVLDGHRCAAPRWR